MRVLLLRFDAPLMAFGAVAVDSEGFTATFPCRSMLAGLFGNALGYDHPEHEKLERLQERLRYAVRRDRAGTPLVDYHTVDLGRPHLTDDNAWTTRGARDERAGAFSTGTHQRRRHFLADSVLTVALRLDPAGEAPDLDTLAAALQEPERPLFLGRKCCLPSAPIGLGIVEAAGLHAALEQAPFAASGGKERRDTGALLACWPVEDGEPAGAMEVALTEDRNWHHQLHMGRRFRWEGVLTIPEATDHG